MGESLSLPKDHFPHWSAGRVISALLISLGCWEISRSWGYESLPKGSSPIRGYYVSWKKSKKCRNPEEPSCLLPPHLWLELFFFACFTHSFNHLFIQHLLCSRLAFRCWEYSSKQNKNLCLHGISILMVCVTKPLKVLCVNESYQAPPTPRKLSMTFTPTLSPQVRHHPLAPVAQWSHWSVISNLSVSSRPVGPSGARTLSPPLYHWH